MENRYGQGSSRLVIIVLTCIISTNSMAAPRYGLNLAIPIRSSEPENLHGIQVFANYDPDRFHWRKFNILFDAGYSHFATNTTPYYSTISIYSIAPIIRYTFTRKGFLQPYLDLSIGLAYLNHTRLENRNLGIHFSFQDRAGLGAFFGIKKQIAIGINAVHYSNAHLSSHNSGITIPLVLDISYSFN